METAMGTLTETSMEIETTQDHDYNNTMDVDPESPEAKDSLEASTPNNNNNNNDLPSFSKLFRFALPERNELCIAMLLMLFAEATGMVIPIVIAASYDDAIDRSMDAQERMARVNVTMIKVIAIQFAGVVASFGRSAIMTAAGERVVARLRNSLYHKILTQEVAFFDETKSGELISRLGSDTTLIQTATSQAIPEVVLGVMKVVVCIALMWFISIELTGLSLAIVLFLFVLCVPFGKKLGTLSKEYQDVLAQAQSYSTEVLGNVRTVLSFAAEEKEAQRYRDTIGDPDDEWNRRCCWIPKRRHNDNNNNNNKRTTYNVGLAKSLVSAGFFTTSFGVGFLSMNVCLWYGFKMVVDGKLNLGMLVAFNSYIFQIGFGLGMTSNWLIKVLEARGASQRIFELIERKPKIPSQNDRKYFNRPSSDDKHSAPKSIQGHIEFRNVSFAYPSRPDTSVLKSFDLTIPPNTTAALVGSSGAGKSTVVSILQRFYDVADGNVYIDGHDIRGLNLKWLRQNIGYVQQEPQLFGLTVRDNVCYGLDRKVTDEELIRVCKEANAHDFISEWPQGYDTMVGERGVKLSGGQKQRISIARALIVNPQILLLDEATSALDSESEHLVQEAIERAVTNRTVVIVAHRLSTIKNASQIVVLDHHEVVDIGTHDELMERCDKYQELTVRQTAG